MHIHLNAHPSTSVHISRYADSKLALTSFTLELADRWKDDITVYDMCPGPVASSIASDVAFIGPYVEWGMRQVGVRRML